MKNIDMVKVRLVPDYKLRSDVPIATSADAIQLLKEELSQFDREAICILNLNTKMKPINASIAAVGDVSSASVHPRDVFKSAVLSSASGFILMHNHPSGDLTPSTDDICITIRLIEAGKIIGIRLIDHIIVGLNSEYCSMREQNLIQEWENVPFGDMQNLMIEPVIEIPDGQNKEQGGFEIQRSIDGTEQSIPLTRDEVCSVYFEQQREFDRETIVGYLEEVGRNPKESQIFKLKHDIGVKKVLSSEAVLQRLTAEFRRQKNKQGIDESILLENVLEKELADIPKRTRRTKELER